MENKARNSINKTPILEKRPSLFFLYKQLYEEMVSLVLDCLQTWSTRIQSARSSVDTRKYTNPLLDADFPRWQFTCVVDTLEMSHLYLVVYF